MSHNLAVSAPMPFQKNRTAPVKIEAFQNREWPALDAIRLGHSKGIQ
jgi:hypothetical protein